MEISLLEYLAFRSGNEYVSDFRGRFFRRVKLSYVLKNKLQISDFPDQEWIGACSYITGHTARTAKEAWEILLHFCEEGNLPVTDPPQLFSEVDGYDSSVSKEGGDRT